MARTGQVNGFYFDQEVFGDYMQEQSMLNNALIASGVLVHDPRLEKMVGSANNVGTIPFFSSIDNESDALNDDGKTNNTPTELKGKKQTFMAIARMKAWAEKTYTVYLTGKSPLQNLANNLVVPYWRNQWEKDLFATIKGVMGVSEMSTHKTDISTKSGSITDANKIDLYSHLDLGQKAKGDQRSKFTLLICHSRIATNYKKLELIENKKYILPITNEEVILPTLGNMIVLETDTGTVDTSTPGFPIYHSYMLGRGTFLTCDKLVHKPYYAAFDAETDGGVEKIYTKQAKVLHPNGFSMQVDNIAAESPTREELETAANWKLCLDPKQITIAEIISNG